MFYNPQFKNTHTQDLVRIIRMLHIAGQDATAAQREYNWRNAVTPMSLK